MMRADLLVARRVKSREEYLMKHTPTMLTIAVFALLVPRIASQGKSHPLESPAGLRLHNVSAVPAMLHGKRGLRVTISEEASRQLASMAPDEQSRLHHLAVLEGLEFSSGVIEAEIAGAPAPGAFEGARGFVGLAFRLQEDMVTYDTFYLRPTNGRTDDQERRNHAVQYAAPPAWPWFRLRKEFPSRYEAYVDLLPNVWTNIKIEVRGARARLYVHDQEQPTLIVNDLKSGSQGKGYVALSIDRSTVAHFRNLTVQPASNGSATK
jgi:hypothetical protein